MSGRWKKKEGPSPNVKKLPGLFFFNPILPKLAMCIARGAFRDYSTTKELLEIPPPFEMQIYHLHWDPRVLDKPFYDSQEGEIEKANLFAKRFSALGRRTGYSKPPTVYDFRDEGFHIIDKTSPDTSPPRSL